MLSVLRLRLRLIRLRLIRLRLVSSLYRARVAHLPLGTQSNSRVL